MPIADRLVAHVANLDHHDDRFSSQVPRLFEAQIDLELPHGRRGSEYQDETAQEGSSHGSPF
jgi:hypothetical protein